jgi:hypothetical protein
MFRVAAAAALLVASALAGPAAAQSMAGVQARAQSGLSYADARRMMPGLTQTTFAKADANGDGVIEGSEANMLQALYRQSTRRN